MPEPASRPWPWLWLALALHSIGFFALYPRAWLVHDETFYVAQALAFADGRTTSEAWDEPRQAFVRAMPSQYPPGTSLLMAAPVRAFGPHGAVLVSWLASIGLVLASAKWLALEGCSPLFALLTLTYPPTLVASRLAMSDLPSAAFVALALWMFALSVRRQRAQAMFGAGLIAGAAVCLRETNPLLLAPLFAGALLRRDRFAGWLVAGGLLGVGLRLLLARWLFGDALFAMPLSTRFSLHDLLRHLPVYAIASLVFMPGGLIWVLRYRGARRVEIIGTALGIVALYASYDYAGEASGFAKSLILGPRYLIPLTPVLALCTASVVASTACTRLLAVAGCIMPLACALSMHAYEAQRLPLERALAAHVRSGDVVITDSLASAKLLLSIGELRTIELDALHDARALAAIGAPIWLVIVDRDDSAFWRELRDAHALGVRELERQLSLRHVIDLANLNLWRVLEPQNAHTPVPE